MARISLEQWRALVAVVEAGGYAQAAERLHKSQSSVSYAVQKLERSLNVQVFRVEGRKAQLTEVGAALLQRAKTLLDDAEQLEHGAQQLAAGIEPVLELAVEILFPTWLLLQCLEAFAEAYPKTHVELHETVLGGTDEAILARRVDLAISPRVPVGFAGQPLLPVRFIPVAHPDHPLHRLNRALTFRDLRQHRQLVIRDSGSDRDRDRDSGAWLGADQRWTVSNKATSIQAVRTGLGFAWFAEHIIQPELQSGDLRPLPMRPGHEREATLYLILPDGDFAGPGATALAEIIRQRSTTCSPEPESPPLDSARQ